MARIIIHPGEHLADELKALGMSANELAKELGVPTNRLTQIMRGNAALPATQPCALAGGSARGRISGSTCKKNSELRMAALEIGDALKKFPSITAT